MIKSIIHEEASILDSMRLMSELGEKCLVVVDNSNKVLGTLSDGDLRKAVLRSMSVRENIADVYQKEPVLLRVDDIQDKDILRKLFLENRYDILPVINEAGELVDVIAWESVFENENEVTKQKSLDMDVVIMAGGKGTRLKPFTNVLPKPLVPIHDKPIIEHIIERFLAVGSNTFHLTINYKARLLKAYFEELQPEYKLNFVEEKEPLGTAGSLQMLDGLLHKPFFMTNCDILLDIDLTSFVEFHREGKYDISLVASAKEFVIPYGTCELDDEGYLFKINEKPKNDYLINTGLYILNPSVLKYIPKNTFYHITQLIEDISKSGLKVGVYPVDDKAWVDIGQWAEYKKALEYI